jgi:hypothetical protein
MSLDQTYDILSWPAAEARPLSLEPPRMERLFFAALILHFIEEYRRAAT